MKLIYFQMLHGNWPKHPSDRATVSATSREQLSRSKIVETLSEAWNFAVFFLWFHRENSQIQLLSFNRADKLQIFLPSKTAQKKGELLGGVCQGSVDVFQSYFYHLSCASFDSFKGL